MADDDSLVDEFEELQIQKKDIEAKEEELKKKIIALAQQNNTDILFGTNKKCLVKAYEKIIYPEDKELLIKTIKEKGLYDLLSHLNYPRLSSKIIKNEIDSEIIQLVRKEKAFRVYLGKIEG